MLLVEEPAALAAAVHLELLLVVELEIPLRCFHHKVVMVALVVLQQALLLAVVVVVPALLEQMGLMADPLVTAVMVLPLAFPDLR
jgi:hypothetical protein